MRAGQSPACPALRMVKPTRLPRAGSWRTSTSLTDEPAGPPTAAARAGRAVRRGPSATTSTEPSGWLATQPSRPSRAASRCTNQRKPTPWTRSRARSATRRLTGRSSCGVPAPRRRPRPRQQQRVERELRAGVALDGERQTVEAVEEATQLPSGRPGRPRSSSSSSWSRSRTAVAVALGGHGQVAARGRARPR